MAVEKPGTYVFDNAAEQSARRFQALPAVYDPSTRRFLLDRGIEPGWHCLEVGAGSGTIAAWLAERVGPTGRVVATDIDTRFLSSSSLPNLEVWRHNLAVDPLPGAAFDLVHARLVIEHVPGPDGALASLVGALKPGGWIVVEDFTPAPDSDPELDPDEVPLTAVLLLQRLVDGRVDLTFGRRAAGCMRALGLVDIGAESHGFQFRGGTPGAMLIRMAVEQLREPILATGEIEPQQFEADLARLDDPGFAILSPVMWTTWGRRQSS